MGKEKWYDINPENKKQIFFDQLKRNVNIPEVAERDEFLFEWMQSLSSGSGYGQFFWGKGTKQATFLLRYGIAKKSPIIFTVDTNGCVEIRFDNLKKFSAYESETSRLDLLKRLDFWEEKPNKRIQTFIYVYLKKLDDTLFERFMDIINEIYQQITDSTCLC